MEEGEPVVIYFVEFWVRGPECKREAEERRGVDKGVMVHKVGLREGTDRKRTEGLSNGV